jgi:hypothetical protein
MRRRKLSAPMFSVNQLGRGNEPMIAVGRVRSAVAFNMLCNSFVFVAAFRDRYSAIAVKELAGVL